MINISHHAGVLIVDCEETGELFFDIYDETYPKKCFRGAVNLTGGNYSAGDSSPRTLLERELKEEFSTINSNVNTEDHSLIETVGFIGKRVVRELALKAEIDLIRENLIKSFYPLGDYLAKFPAIETSKAFDTLYSVFVTKITGECLEVARKNIELNRCVRNEGLSKICCIDDIASGKIVTAWATGNILGEYWGTRVPNPFKIITERIGMPRRYFKDYLKDFEYRIKFE